MGIIFSVPMREDQVEDKIKSDVDKATIKDIRTSISNETSAREAGDISLKADVTDLRQNLDDERINREESELDIRRDFRAALESETNIRIADYVDLESSLKTGLASMKAAIDEEKTTRISEDSAVIQAVASEYDPKISNLTSALANEVTLSAERSATMYAALTSSIAAVDSEKTTGSASLKSAIDNEVSTRKGQTDSLSAAITKEVADRQSAVSSIQSAISTAVSNEATTRAAADSALQTSLKSAQDGLSKSISDEATLRANADSALQSSIASAQSNLNTAISNEATLRANADSALQSSIASAQSNLNTAISNEATLRAKADSNLESSIASAQSNLNTAISNEASARSAADSALQSSITSAQSSLNTAISNEASTRAAAVTNLQSSITSAVGNIQANLKDFTPSTTQAAGKSGFVPAPPKLSASEEVLILTNSGFRTLADTGIIISTTPSQSTVPQYTGSTITPQWANFESQKLTYTGTTSATNAGTYTAKFKPVGIYHWADGTQDEISVTWRIAPQNVQVPTASVTSFTYDGNAKTLSVTNPNAAASSQTGTISATAAGNYTATYKLKSTTNYIWSDNTTADKNISWTIAVLKLAKPTATNISFTYDGENHSPTISNYNSTYETKTGTDTAKAAASYSITYALKDTTNTKWADNTTANVVINWTISKVQVTIPTASTTEFTYNGSAKNLSVTNPQSTLSSQTGTISATVAGNYTATYKLKDSANYQWTDGTITDKSISWKIIKASVTIPTASTTEFTYSGSAKNLSVTNPQSSLSSQTGTVSATVVGDYTATYKLKDSANYQWADGTITDKSISWTIVVLKLDKPTATNISFTYDNKDHSPTISNYNSTYETKTGTDTAKAAASYSITYALKDTTNTKWADNTTANVVINWTIAKVQVTIPTAAITTYDYTGKEISLGISNPDSTYITQSGTSKATATGDYTVTFTLKDTANYVWKDGTNTAKSITWTIEQTGFAKPTAAVTTFTYNKGEQAPVVTNFDATYMTKTGTESATNVGTYTITYALKDKENNKWSDASTDDVVITWKINALLLTKPTAETKSFEYDGTLKSLSVADYNSNYESVAGTLSAIDAGSYSVTYSLNDTTNTKWVGNSTADVTISWKITRKKLTAEQSSFYSADNNTKIVWDAREHNATEIIRSSVDGSQVYDATLFELTSDTTAVEVGMYRVTITPKANYAWSNGQTVSKNITWYIIKSSTVPKPTAAVTSFEYTGATIILDVDNYNTTYIERLDTGTYSATEVGTYFAKYALKDSAHYTWANGTSSTVFISWKITRKLIEKPSISGDTSFVYNTKTQQPTVINYSATYMEQSGSVSAIDAGTYTITYALKDTANTAYISGTSSTTSAVKLTWTITRAPMSEELSTGFAQAEELTYNGAEQTLTVTNYNPTYHVLSGTTKCTNYRTNITAYIAPSANYAWADGTTARKTITWAIQKKVLAIPTVLGASSFVYDGSTKKLTLSGFDEETMYIANSVEEAVDKGSYVVKVYLLHTSNMKWADGTTSYKTFNWSITANPVTKPTRTDSNIFTYDGNAKTITIANYDSTTTTFSGTISETNAGNYSATYTLKDTQNYSWADGTTADVVINWSIARAKLSEAQSTWRLKWNEKEFYAMFDYWSTIIETDDSSASNYVVNDGPLWTRPAGTYTFNITPDSNHLWNDGSTTPITLTYTVTKAVIPKVHISNATVFDYDGNTKSIKLEPSRQFFDPITGAPINTSVYKKYTVTGNTSGVNVGIYQAVVSLDYPSDTIWDDGTTDDVILQWEITTGEGFTKPYLSSENLQWTGDSITPSVVKFDSNTMTMTGDTSATNLGDYTITFALKDKSNTKWSDDTTDNFSVTWHIVRKRFSATNSNPAVSTEFTYSSSAKNAFNYLTGCDKANTTIGGVTTATNVGTYVLTVTPNANYAWNDGTTAAKSVSWKINPLTLTKPSLTNTTYTFDGNIHQPTINDYNSTYESQTGTISASDVGTYTVTYSLKDKTNTTWKDGSTNDVGCTWVINVLKLTKPNLLNTSFEYDGNEHAPTPNNYNDTYEELTGTAVATDAGTYTVTYKLRNTTNTLWADGTKADISCTWTIGLLSFAKPSLSNTTFTYDGNAHSPALSNYDENYISVTGTTSATNAGTYTVTYSLKDKTNTAWKDGSTNDVGCTWTIGLLSFAKPSLSNTTFTYDGNAHSPALSNYDENYISVTGTTSATNAGTYTVTYSLKDKTNTTWKDGSTNDVGCTWTINKATPTLSLSANSVTLNNSNSTTTIAITYTGDGTLSVTKKNNTPEIVSVACSLNDVNITGLNYGTDTVTVSASSTANYKAPFSKTISVDSKFLGTLENTSFAGIQYAARSHYGRSVWDIGDSKVVSLTGWAQNCSVKIMILGFSHNPAIEGTNTIHFAILGNATGGTTKKFGFLLCENVIFKTDSRHLSTEETQNYDKAGDVYGTSKICKFFSATSGGFLDVFPDDLKTVMKATNKYYAKAHPTNTKTDLVNHYKGREMMIAERTNEKIWLIGAAECSALGYYSVIDFPPGVSLNGYQGMYSYFQNGNKISDFEQSAMRISPNYKVDMSPVAFNTSDSNYKTQRILTRDMASCGSSTTSGEIFSYCINYDLSDNGKILQESPDVEGIIIPCFAIG